MNTHYLASYDGEGVRGQAWPGAGDDCDVSVVAETRMLPGNNAPDQSR